MDLTLRKHPGPGEQLDRLPPHHDVGHFEIVFKLATVQYLKGDKDKLHQMWGDLIEERQFGINNSHPVHLAQVKDYHHAAARAVEILLDDPDLEEPFFDKLWAAWSEADDGDWVALGELHGDSVGSEASMVLAFIALFHSIQA